MPIKFRCHFCHQFLGIARSRSGEMTTCPTCGRSIRIPSEDGFAEVLQEVEHQRPEGLSAALRDLALLFPESPAAGAASPKPIPRRDIAPEEAVFTKSPEPIPLELPVEIAPIPLAEHRFALRETGSDLPRHNSHSGGAFTESQWRELLQLLAPVPMISAQDSPEVRPRAVSRFALWPVAVGIVGGLLLGFVFGALLPRNTLPLEPAHDAAAPALAGDLQRSKAIQPQVTGRVNYQSGTGETLPDVGAVVVCVPQERAGTLRLPPTGLRPGDEAADFQAVRAILQSWGGDAAVVQDNGDYLLPVREPGHYWMVCLSAFSERSTPMSFSPEVQKFLARDFQASEDLWGMRNVVIQALDVKNLTETRWDVLHSPM